MSKLLQLRGGTTSEHSTFTGALREVTVDTTKDTLVVHDGSTAGGFPLLLATGSGAALTGITVDGAQWSGSDLDVVNGGTGASSAGAARTNLGVDPAGTVNYTHPANHAISVVTGLQAALDGKTTESFVTTAITNLVDSSPAALDTLNELAAALGDDAAFSTTVTNSIATKLPLSGGAMTGAITTNSTFDGRDVAADGVTADAALPKAGGAMTGAITTNSTFDGVDIAVRDAILTSTTTTAGAALPKAGGAMTGAITTNSTFDGRDVAADGVTADAALPKAGGTMSGLVNMADNVIQRPEIKDYSETVQAMAANDVDLSLGNVQTKSIAGSQTLTFSNPPASGKAGSFTLIATLSSTPAITWPASVDWAGGTAPTLTAAGVDIFSFVTTNGGTTWFGFTAGADMQ